jgi:hypothetical protein
MSEGGAIGNNYGMDCKSVETFGGFAGYVDKIGTNLMRDCPRVKWARIAGLSNGVGQGMFGGCLSLMHVDLTEATINALPNSDVFSNCLSLSEIIVNADEEEAYKAKWPQFAAIIKSDEDGELSGSEGEEI